MKTKMEKYNSDLGKLFYYTILYISELQANIS